MHINSHTSSDTQSHDLNRICRSKRIINLFQIYRCCYLNAQWAIQGPQHLLTSQAELGVLPCGNNSSIFWYQLLIQYGGQKGGWLISSGVSISACFILLLALRLLVSCVNPQSLNCFRASSGIVHDALLLAGRHILTIVLFASHFRWAKYFSWQWWCLIAFRKTTAMSQVWANILFCNTCRVC